MRANEAENVCLLLHVLLIN